MSTVSPAPPGPLPADAWWRALGLPPWIGASLLDLARMDLAAHPQLELPARLGNSVEKRRREFLGGRICAREALRLAGHPAAAYPAMGEDRLPVWPSGWLGSISHSGGLAMALAAPASACRVLGVDVQERKALGNLDGVQSLVAAEGELDVVAGFDAITRLLLLFSAKEALYKALHPQVRAFQDFGAARLSGFGETELELRLAHDWSSEWPAGTGLPVRYTLSADYIVTAVFLPA